MTAYRSLASGKAGRYQLALPSVVEKGGDEEEERGRMGKRSQGQAAIQSEISKSQRR